ncbi:MAG: amidohydrolase [Chloroflexi bacterium]|nr:amidohydrolase [Chloroflexota bacterium]
MPEIILHNARITTQNPAQPWAQALAIKHGRIIDLGADADILPLTRGHTQTIDLQDRLVLPGFTDSHIHFHDMAQRRGQLELYQATSLNELQQQLAAYVRPLAPGAWCIGYGWNESRWPQPIFPTRHDLDPLTGDRPAILWRTDLHAAVANSVALRAAGIDAATPDPPSGVIDRHRDGRPTGVLRELAINLVRQVIPPLDEATATANLLAVAADLQRWGIVAVHDQRMKDHSHEGPQALRLYTRLRQQNRLPLRISCNIEAAHMDHLIALGLQSGFGDEWLRIGHIKLFADGSLGAQTAWMLAPYANDPANRGMFLTDPAHMAAVIRRAHRHGLAVSVHAIGDGANREVLDIFTEVQTAGSHYPPLIPHRIEHVQALHPHDQPRLGALHITASMQPIHCPDDITNADRLWGQRSQNAFVFRTLLDSGATLAFGSDAPVASANPWWGIHAAVTRQRLDGSPIGGWHPQQRLTVAEAIAAYTLGAATAIGRQQQQGRLAPGYLADLIVLDTDLFRCDPAQIPHTNVLLTMINGRIVYRAV